MTGLRHILMALGFCVATGGKGLAEPSGLIRLTDRENLFGWEAVGRVDIGPSGFCTGVLIAPDQVLTAAHCLYDPAGQPLPAEMIRFRSGLRDGLAIAESEVIRYAAARGYDPGAGMNADNVRRDAALLELATPIQSALAAPFRLYDSPRAGQRVSVVSYGQNRDSAPSWQRDCGLLWRAEGLMAFDCNVISGSSGAPVFAREGGRARILSLVSGGNWQTDDKRAIGMELPALVDGLKRDLRVMQTAPAAGVGFRRLPAGDGARASGAKFARP